MKTVIATFTSNVVLGLFPECGVIMTNIFVRNKYRTASVTYVTSVTDHDVVTDDVINRVKRTNYNTGAADI